MVTVTHRIVCSQPHLPCFAWQSLWGHEAVHEGSVLSRPGRHSPDLRSHTPNPDTSPQGHRTTSTNPPNLRPTVATADDHSAISSMSVSCCQKSLPCSQCHRPEHRPLRSKAFPAYITCHMEIHWTEIYTHAIFTPSSENENSHLSVSQNASMYVVIMNLI